jgi:hypothetical protein
MGQALYPLSPGWHPCSDGSGNRGSRFSFGQYCYETLASRPSNSLSRRQWRDFGGCRGNRSDLGRTVRGLLRFAPADIGIHLDRRPTEAHGSGTEPPLMAVFFRDGLRTWALLAPSPLVRGRTVWRDQAIGLLGCLVRSPPIGSQLVKRRGPAACGSFAAVASRPSAIFSRVWTMAEKPI